MTAAIVVAAADNDVVGAHGDLPWRIREDLAHFKRLTTGHALIVGRVTHESILRANGGPLAGRRTIVLTRSPAVAAHDGVTFAHTLADAMDRAEAYRVAHGQQFFYVGGGAQLYAAALPLVGHVFLTRVHGSPDGDARMPVGWLDGFHELSSRVLTDDDGVSVCSFRELSRVP